MSTDDRIKAARRLGISANTIKSRLHAGWDLEKALTTPKRSGFKQSENHPWKHFDPQRARRG